MNDDEGRVFFLDEIDRDTIRKIEEFGHQVTFVFPTEDDDGSPFAYTVGRTIVDRPELLMTGPLAPEVMTSILNDAVKMDDETPLVAGQEVEGLLRGFKMRVIEADPEAAEMNMAIRLFYVEGDPITALQLVWPDQAGNFPGDDEYVYPEDVQPVYPKP